MKSKYLMLFLIFFLFLPIVHARFYTEYSSSQEADKYCEIYLVQYIPDETKLLQTDQQMWFSVSNKCLPGNITVDYTNYLVTQNISSNLTNATPAGFWDKTYLTIADSFNHPRIDLPWYIELFGGPTAGMVGQFNLASSAYDVFFDVKSGSFTVGDGITNCPVQTNTTYFSMGTTTSYRLRACQDSPRIAGQSKIFEAFVKFPDSQYTPCDTKNFVNYLFEWFYSLFAVLMEFVAIVTETWFILYWILKIGIIIGVVFGSIWLIMYIYRLVRDTLR